MWQGGENWGEEWGWEKECLDLLQGVLYAYNHIRLESSGWGKGASSALNAVASPSQMGK